MTQSLIVPASQGKWGTRDQVHWFECIWVFFLFLPNHMFCKLIWIASVIQFSWGSTMCKISNKISGIISKILTNLTLWGMIAWLLSEKNGLHALHMLSKNFSETLRSLFYHFYQKIGFHTWCKLFPRVTVLMKFQTYFLSKKRKCHSCLVCWSCPESVKG